MTTIIPTLVASAVGQGPSLVTLHASGMSSRQWARLTRDASAQYTVRNADLLGVGATPMGEGAYSLEREATALLALLDAIAEPVHLAAHSYGGLVAMEAALRAPEKIRSMALYEPVIVVLAGAHGSPEARAEIARIGELMAIDTSASYEAWLEAFIDWWNGPGFFRTLPAPSRDVYLSTAHEAHRQAGVVSSSTLTVERLRSLEIPTVFLVGESSPAAARESAALAADAMPHGRLLRVQGAGHMGPLTHTAHVNGAMLAHFAAH